MESSWSIEHYEAALKEANDAMTELRTLLGANEGESNGDALHRYTAAVQLGCALKLEQRAKEVAEQPAIVPVLKVREVTVAALIGGATLLRQGVTSAGDAPASYPCSTTCTHDDATKPGHPERVKAASEAVNKVTADPSFSNTEAAAYEQGAEAMRAACWEVIQTELRLHGWGPGDGPWTRLKAAIEGAAP